MFLSSRTSVLKFKNTCFKVLGQVFLSLRTSVCSLGHVFLCFRASFRTSVLSFRTSVLKL